MIFGGIDPGQKGALVLLDGSEVIAYPWDGDIREWDVWIEKWPELVCIEKTFAGPSHRGATTLSELTGRALGLLELRNVPYRQVPVQTWRSRMLAGHKWRKSADAKKAALEIWEREILKFIAGRRESGVAYFRDHIEEMHWKVKAHAKGESYASRNL